MKQLVPAYYFTTVIPEDYVRGLPRFAVITRNGRKRNEYIVSRLDGTIQNGRLTEIGKCTSEVAAIRLALDAAQRFYHFPTPECIGCHELRDCEMMMTG